MSNIYSKRIERKKEKEESEYLKEMKEKYSPKIKKDLFQLISKIQKDEKILSREKKKTLLELQLKLMSIGLYAIDLKSVGMLYKLVASHPEFDFTNPTDEQDENRMMRMMSIIQIALKEFISEHFGKTIKDYELVEKIGKILWDGLNEVESYKDKTNKEKVNIFVEIVENCPQGFMKNVLGITCSETVFKLKDSNEYK